MKIDDTVQRDKAVSIWLIYGLWAVFIGVLCFIFVYGVSVLDVTNDVWLLNGEDLNQHYLGWKFYRNSTWQFPVGLIEGLTDASISVIYTDSIPLFAILFKVLSPFLPETFQYFGIWGITCYILQAFFAMALLHPFLKNREYVIIGSIIFVFSPIVLFRMFIHSALGGNWIILAALAVWFNRRYAKNSKIDIMLWSIIMALAVLTHMYFLPMVFAIMCANLLNKTLDKRGIESKRLLLLSLGIPIAFASLTMFVLGAFYGSPDVIQEGVRAYSSNLNTLYNSINFSKVLKGLPLVSGAQVEGFGYLGAGILCGLLLGLFGWILKGEFKKKVDIPFFISLITVAVVVGGYALSPTITWNDKIVLMIPWPNVIIQLFSVFRVTGRFIWPICYIVFALTIVLLREVYGKKWGNILLVSITVLQIWDISALVHSSAGKVSAQTPSLLQDSVWKDFQGNFDKIAFITNNGEIDNQPLLIVNYFSMKQIFDLANYACDNDMNLTDFYIGRRNGKYIEKEKNRRWQELESGGIDKKTVYVFSEIPYALLALPQINIYDCDGYIIGITSEFDGKTDSELNAMKFQIISIIQEHKNIIGGEDREGRRVIHPDGVSFGPYITLGKGRYRITASGENLDKAVYDVFSNELNKNFPIDNFQSTSDSIQFEVKFDKNISEVEFRIFNLKDVDIIIDEFYGERMEGE